jgi:hypothetical protein
VPDREHQTIVAGIPRVGGVVVHLPVHQLDDDVAQGEGAGWMPRTRRRRHADDVLAELNRLGMRGRNLREGDWFHHRSTPTILGSGFDFLEGPKAR